MMKEENRTPPSRMKKKTGTGKDGPDGGAAWRTADALQKQKGRALTDKIIRMYPKMTEDDFARLCPVCRVNCNCKSCLRLEVPKKVGVSMVVVESVVTSIYIYFAEDLLLIQRLDPDFFDQMSAVPAFAAQGCLSKGSFKS